MWKLEVTGTPDEVEAAVANAFDNSDHERLAKAVHDRMLEAIDAICAGQKCGSKITVSAECKTTRNHDGYMEYHVTMALCVMEPLLPAIVEDFIDEKPVRIPLTPLVDHTAVPIPKKAKSRK